MEEFKILLQFTLQRRIKNNTFLIVNMLLALLIVLVFCCDFYLPSLFPSWNQKTTIACSSIELCERLESFTSDYEIMMEEKGESEADFYIDEGESYDVWVNHDCDDLTIAALEITLRQIEEISLIESGQLTLRPIYIHSNKEEDSHAQTWGFFCITAVYFIALSFAGSVANDVVYEKATRMMELILTSVDASIHLAAKLVGGWLLLLIQLGILLLDFLICFIVRFIYDRGEGLFELAYQAGLLPKVDVLSVKSILQWLSQNKVMLGYLLLALILMFLGILLVQSILVIFSSFISSIEEAGNIQSPFYLVLMGVYYLTIFVNNSESMNHGLGRILSLMPFFSMLCMPCRIFYHSIPIAEIGISLVSAIGALLLVIVLGTPLYQRGVLNYSVGKDKKKISSLLNI